MTKKIIWIGAVLALAAVAQADAPSVAKNPAEELQCLIGKWSGKGQLQVGDKNAKLSGTYTCTAASGGLGVKCRAEIRGVPGLERYVSDELWGYDPGSGSVHWFTVTNAGETHDHAGKIGADDFSGRYEGLREGRALLEEVRFHFQSQSKLHVKSVVKVAGEAVETLHMRLEKHDG